MTFQWEEHPNLPNPKWFIIAVVLFVLFFWAVFAYAYTDEQIADAIFKAEGVKSRFPYGILVKYKHTTPRQACINTIKHARRDWNGKEDFIAFLGSRYCPVGAKNDPKNLNKNWLKNVKFYLERRKK